MDVGRRAWQGLLIASSLLVCAAALWTSSPPGARAAGGCTSTLVPGSHPLSIVVRGERRFALVHVPRAPAGRRLPLVLALHGYGGSGPRMEPYSGFSALADAYGFIVAYPSALGLAWNSTAAKGQPDDASFLTALIADLEGKMCADSGRVLATGVSNGAGMVALAGCELRSRITAIAPVAGGYDGQPPCHPTHPLSVLEIHGTADQVVPYFGRTMRPTKDGVPPFVNAWVQRDGCSPRASMRALAPRTTMYVWSRCRDGARVEHIRIRGGRHQWPGATPPDPGPPSTICAACAIWSFFSSVAPSPHVRPAG
ncbi:MAG: alpha/beta hydrolase family esterase [Solirubrobacteraceae bacterium]